MFASFPFACLPCYLLRGLVVPTIVRGAKKDAVAVVWLPFSGLAQNMATCVHCTKCNTVYKATKCLK